MRQGIIKNDVYIQDQSSEIVDVFFCKLLNNVTLSSPVVMDTYTATFVAWHWFVSGNLMCLKEWSNFFQAEVLSVSWNVVTIDRPFDYGFTINTSSQRTTKEMNIDWSITKQVFRVTPVWLDVKFDILKVNFHMESWSPMDNWLFWSLPKLAKWLVLRKKDWVFKSIFNAKTNGEFSHHCEYIQYDTKAPSWVYWLKIIKHFNWQENHWVVVRLDPEKNEQLEIIIQDNLIGLTEFHVTVQGHVVID